jgi:iron complex transport system substrate-binding protein
MWCRAVLVAWCVAACVNWGCESNEEALHDSDVRIVSLSPAMTSMAVGVGLGDVLVGRSAYCQNVDHLPVAGDLEHINAEMLVRLRPTHVMVQRSSGDVDQRLVDLANQYQWTIVAQPLRDFRDVDELLTRLPSIDDRADIDMACRQQRGAMDAALQPTPTPSGIRVLLVSGGPTPLAWGGETYLGELLAAAGGVNVLPDVPWQSVSMEDIARLGPDLLVVIGPSGMDDEHWPSSCRRVAALSHPDLDIPGPHVVTIREDLDRLLKSPSTYTEAP